MKKAIVVSLSFHPGHVSHMIASYKQFEELGFESYYCVSEGFKPYIPDNSRVIIYGTDKIQNVDVAIFVFPSQNNLLLIRKLKKQGAGIIYIFHEPLAPMIEYRKAGFSYKYLAKLWVVNQISRLTVKWSDIVFLPSKKAVEFYDANPIYSNKNIVYVPLLYDDERTEQLARIQRKYFSYIGTVAADHSFKEYLQFVEWAVKENCLPWLNFLIATKSDFDVPQVLVKSSRVVIQKGRPLSNEEINENYASTSVVWNAYARTTQSGVLAKSFMFGTPAIVLKKNLSEFVIDGKEVVAIDDNTSFEEIERAVLRITSDFEHYSSSARMRFENTFFYRRYNEEMEKVMCGLSDDRRVSEVSHNS